MLSRPYWCRGPARSGAAAVELAILVPTLTFILVAVADFSRVYYHYVTITNCASNGAIYGSANTTQSTDTTGIQAAALKDAVNLSPQPTVARTNGTDGSGNPYVEVTVAYTFNTLVICPGIPSTVNLSRTVRMRVAQTTPN